MALKLIPKASTHPINVQVIDFKGTTPDHPKPLVTARVKGDSIESVWLEYYIDRSTNEPNPRGIPSMNHTWAKVGRSLWKAPYMFSLDQTKLPPGRVQLRVAAANLWEDRGTSQPFTVDVSTANAQKR